MNPTDFSIVAYLSGEDLDLVRKLQEEIYAVTGSRKCLDDWTPHITVGDGVTVSNERFADIENKLQNIAQNTQPFTIRARGFGGTGSWKGALLSGATPYVLWLDVEVGKDLLSLFHTIQNDVTSTEEVWLPRTVAYAPHITIAFFDLTEEGYGKGMAYLAGKSFDRDIDIGHISLVECFGEGNMTSREYKRFSLGVI